VHVIVLGLRNVTIPLLFQICAIFSQIKSPQRSALKTLVSGYSTCEYGHTHQTVIAESTNTMMKLKMGIRTHVMRKTKLTTFHNESNNVHVHSWIPLF